MCHREYRVCIFSDFPQITQVYAYDKNIKFFLVVSTVFIYTKFHFYIAMFKKLSMFIKLEYNYMVFGIGIIGLFGVLAACYTDDIGALQFTTD